MVATRAPAVPARLNGSAHELRRPLRARPARYERLRPGEQAEHDEDDFDEEEADAQEDEETRARFSFPLEKKRQSIAAHFVDALRRKRRMLRRSENLRFRELYRAPEPAAVAIAVLLVTVVTLILTKSWPFY
jgi:hypothetical protein